MSELKKDLLERKREIVAGDEAKIAKQKAAGKLTARQRIAMLLDEGSFVEIGALVKSADASGESVVTGYGTVDARPVYVYAQDFTVKGGAVDALQAKKIVRVMQLAQKTGAPLVAVMDSAGASLKEGAAALEGYAQIIAGHARLSGVVPQIALVAGPCVGAAAVAASACDFTVMTQKISALLSQGAQIVSAKSGKDYTPETLGGAAAADKAGACAYAAADEAEAIGAVKRILAFLPSNNMEEAPAYEGEDLNRPIAAGTDPAYLASQLADGGEAMALYAGFAPEMYCGFVKLGGFCAGIVANNAAENDGVITPDAAAKAAKFIGICDSFNIPVVSLINTVGFVVDGACENFSSVQGGAKLAFAYAQANVPKVSVVIGKAIGGGYAVMGSKALGADMTYAWPQAVIAPLNGDAGARILYNAKIREGMPVQEAQEKYEADNCPFAAAASGAVDDVIAPEATRQYLIAAIDMLYSKREPVLPRKHGNAPM